jgi:sugar lactone lactonase YvrE
MRTRGILVGVFLCVFAIGPAQSQPSDFPARIPLPAGFGPEGIAVGRGSTYFVGAGLGSSPDVLGQILAGDLRESGTPKQLVAPAKKPALGMKFDSKSNLLFVAGGSSGTGRVYNADTGTEVASFQFQVPVPNGPRNTNVNDVIVTKDAAWFTDSLKPTLYRVALGQQGLPEKVFRSIPLPQADFELATKTCEAGARANGVAADPSGKHLIIGNSNRGQLFLMDTGTFSVEQIGLTGGDVCNADGLLLDGKTLFVVQNTNNRIAVVEMSPDFKSGKITRHITEPFASNPDTKVPTTIAEFGDSLFAVTAGFAKPDTDFVVRMPKR